MSIKMLCKELVMVFLLLTVVAAWVVPAHATLREPLQGAALKYGLTPDQHRRAMYFKALKTQMLQTNGSEASEAIQKVELANTIVHSILDISSFIEDGENLSDSVSFISEKTRRIAQASNILANGISSNKFRNYLVKRNGADRAARIFMLTGTFLTVLNQEIPILMNDSLFQQYAQALESDDIDNIVTKFAALLDHPDPWISWIVEIVAGTTTGIVSELPEYLAAGGDFVSQVKSVGLWKGVKAAALAKKAFPVGEVISDSISIVTDIAGAYVAADISAELKTDLIALEFLDYYLVTYKGDLAAFKADIGASASTTIADVFEHFMYQQSGLGQTMKELYGPVDWLDSVFGDKADKARAVELIRKVMRETGSLAFRIGAGTTIAAGDNVAYRFEADPLLLMDYTFDVATVQEQRPNGSTQSHTVTTTGSLAPYTDIPGQMKFDVAYWVTPKGGSTALEYHFSFTDDIFVSSSDITVAPITITPSVTKNLKYDITLNINLPAEFISYSRWTGEKTVSGKLSSIGANIMARAVDLNGDVSTYSDWVDISSGSAAITFPLVNIAAVMGKSGSLGIYQIELKISHPQVKVEKTASYTKSFSYGEITEQPDVSYLAILAPASVRSSYQLAGNGRPLLNLTPTDELHLYPRNTPEWPDFNGLLGIITVWLSDTTGKNWPVPGTLMADGGVKFSITADMPATAYQIIAVASIDSGVKHNAPAFPMQLVMEGVSVIDDTPPTPASTGGLFHWGDNSYGQGNIPQGLTNVTAIAAGGYHCLALKSDGIVVAWGNNIYGQTSVPSGLTNVIAIAAGIFHSLALKIDGTVVAWGNHPEWGRLNVPLELTNVIAISAGDYHSLALKSDGTVFSLGSTGSAPATVPAGLTNVISVSAGFLHSLALKGDGTVVAWGIDSHGQTSVPQGITNVTALVAGGYHSLALKSDGTVVAWGDNTYGQTNVPPGLANVIAIAAGARHSLALKGDGAVVAWGDAGDVGKVPLGLNGVTKIASGGFFNLVLADTIPESIVFPRSIVTAISENLPDGTYQIGPATKAWRFKTGSNQVSGLKAVRIAEDAGVNSTLNEILLGNFTPNTEFLVYLPINPSHYAGSAIKSSYWKFIDGSGNDVPITNSASGQFWVKVRTNRPPVFSQLQLNSVAGKEGQQVCLPILASDPEGDSITYSVTSGGGNVSSYTTPAGTTGWRYCNTFSAGLHAVTVTADDGHGSSASTTFQAVITSDSTLKDFYNDVRYADATTQALKDQYAAIHYLTLYGITIGSPLDPYDPSNLARVFKPEGVANQAEALGIIMKTAAVRGLLDLDVESRWLPNLIKEDAQNGVFYNFSWALPYVLKAEAMGMITSAESFEPNKPVTREWMALMVARMLGLTTPPELINPAEYLFADETGFTAPGDYYDAARAAAYFGYMTGELGPAVSFNPAAEMIRADVAVVAAKILRMPSVDGISTTLPGYVDIAGKSYPAQIHGQSFSVTGLQNLFARRMLGDGTGNIKEDPVFTAADYTTATVIRPGVGVVAGGLAKNLVTTPIVVPTNPPDITQNEVRTLLVMLESEDDEGRNKVRNIFRMPYGVLFPDADKDGVRDSQDLWSNNSLYSTDANSNGIPDNADAVWGLTNRSGSSQIKINGQIMTLQNAVLDGYYAQMMSDQVPPSVISAIPMPGAQEVSLGDPITISFSREIDPATISTATVSLTNLTTSANVPGTISYSLGTLTFVPGASLNYASDYQLSISTGIKDLAGHAMASSYTLSFKTELVVNTPPTGTVSVNNGAQYTTNPLVTLSVSATDIHGVSQMCFSESATSCSSWLTYSTTASFPFAGTGSRTLYAWFSDGKGLANSTPASSASIMVDTLPPSLNLTMIDDGAVSREKMLNVAGYAKDTGTGVKSVTVNGEAVVVNASNGIFSYPLPLSDASTTITVVAEDMAGNRISLTRTIAYDPAAPLLTITAPADNGASSVALMNVTGTVDPGSTVTVSINGGTPVAAQVTGTSFSAQVTLLSTVIANNILIKATGAGGTTTTAKRSIRYSSARWTMDITDPPQDLLTTAGTYLLKGRVANVANAPVAIEIVRGSDTYVPVVTNGVFEQLVTLPSDGVHSFSVTGTDSLGNKTSTVRNIRKGDFDAPIISQFSMPVTSSALQVPLTFTATDNIGITGWCESSTASTPVGCTWFASPPASHTFLSPGTKTLYGYVKDAAGNIAVATTTTTITIPVKQLTVTLAGTGEGSINSSPSGIACVSGSIAGCSAAFVHNTAVTLIKLGSNSTFSGWSGACTGTGNCVVTMDADKSVTATFAADPARLRIDGDGTAYYSFDSVLSAILTQGKVIKVRDQEFIENVIVDSVYDVQIMGGYTDNNFVNRTATSYSTISGSLEIKRGALILDRLVID